MGFQKDSLEDRIYIFRENETTNSLRDNRTLSEHLQDRFTKSSYSDIMPSDIGEIKDRTGFPYTGPIDYSLYLMKYFNKKSDNSRTPTSIYRGSFGMEDENSITLFRPINRSKGEFTYFSRDDNSGLNELFIFETKIGDNYDTSNNRLRLSKMKVKYYSIIDDDDKETDIEGKKSRRDFERDMNNIANKLFRQNVLLSRLEED